LIVQKAAAKILIGGIAIADFRTHGDIVMNVLKTSILALATVLVASGSVMAAPGNGYYNGHRSGISSAERAAIARSQAKVNATKRAAWADGRLSTFERAKIRISEYQRNRTITNARKY
jgi:hypothetical protein